MVKDSAATADARRALGTELAAYRDAAGYSQDRLARLTSYSRSTIANVETGRQRVLRLFWEHADAALRTGGVLASGHDDIEAAVRTERHDAARGASAARQAQPWQQPLDTARDAVVPQEQASQALIMAPLPWWQDELERPAAGELTDTAAGRCQAARTRRASPGDLARLRGIREQLKAIDNSHGGGTALPMAAWYLHREVASLLDGDQLTSGLTEVVTLFFLDLGWMGYDADQQRMATESFTRALRRPTRPGTGC